MKQATKAPAKVDNGPTKLQSLDEICDKVGLPFVAYKAQGKLSGRIKTVTTRDNGSALYQCKICHDCFSWGKDKGFLTTETANICRCCNNQPDLTDIGWCANTKNWISLT